MAPNKDRVYIALYVRGGAPKMPGKEDTYHWAIIVGPKAEDEGRHGIRYHAKESVTSSETLWVFEERDVPLTPTGMLLVRVMIGKVEDKTQLVRVLRSTPIRNGQTGWNCVFWVKEALERLAADGKAMGRSVLEWERVRDQTMQYC